MVRQSECLLTDMSLGEAPSLGEFPQGYTLWGHFTKTKEPDGRGNREKVTHDLYGHPSGEEFRSPAEFLPHLKWLAFDTTGDVANCDCKFCDLNNEAEAAKKRSARAVAMSNAMKKTIIDKGMQSYNTRYYLPRADIWQHLQSPKYQIRYTRPRSPARNRKQI